MVQKTKEGKAQKLLQWHTAFYADLQIELEAEAEFLEFENEHMLGSKPMQLDVLIIKKDRQRQIQKNIGRIFRTYNIVEYKSPEDYLSVDDFFKVYGYTCFYKSDTGSVNEIKAEELTISFVCNRYPRELMNFLEREQHRTIEKVENGIYYIFDAQFAIQLIVQRQLSMETNLWLRCLTNDLQEQSRAEKLLQAYKERQADMRYRSVMDFIVRANEERFQVRNMCDALEELMRDRIAELEQQAEERGLSRGMAKGMEKGMEKGRSLGLFMLVEKKLTKGKSLAQIAEELEESEENILPLYIKAQEKLGMV